MKKYRLEELAKGGSKGLADGPFGSNLKASEYKSEGVPVIRGSNLSKGPKKLKEHEYVFIDRQKADSLVRSKTVRGDIVFTKKGTLGQTGYIDEKSKFLEYNLSSNQMKMTPDNNLVNGEFLYYYLSSKKAIRTLLSESESTGVPKINLDYIRNFKVHLPEREKQDKYTYSLKTLDNKIALNRRQNETLEAMAQALFKSWFVDFDPVIDNALAAGVALPEALQARAARRQVVLESGTYPRLDAKVQALFPDRFEWSEELGNFVPRGWEVKSLADAIQLIGGGTPKTTIEEYWNGDIPWFSVVDAPKHSDVFVIETQKHITELGLEKSSAKLLRKGITIISARGTVGKCAMVSIPMTTNQSCYAIEGNNISDSLTYYYVRHNVADLQSRGHGSVFNTITRSTFESIHVCKPPKKLDVAFDKIVSTYFSRIEESSKENQTLSSLRDLLLGELIG